MSVEIKRRDLLRAAAALGALKLSNVYGQAASQSYRRIAIEEAFVTPDIVQGWYDVIDNPGTEPGFERMASFMYTGGDSNPNVRRLLELGENRIRDMDELGVAVQALSIASPGVQVFDADTAVALSKDANDRLAEAVRRYPDRYVGLATIAPNAPEESARELERAVNELDFRGALINSHTKGEFLDDRKFWPMFEAAEALSVPIYLHPRTPPPQMLDPFIDYRLYFSTWGFGAEVGLHALRMIFGGVFDEFPGLKMILGHMGEGLPYWLYRLDSTSGGLAARRGASALPKPPSEHIRDNFFITVSGIYDLAPLRLCLDVLGAERVFFAMDYPFAVGDTGVAFMDAAPIEESDKQLIYHENAERLFRI